MEKILEYRRVSCTFDTGGLITRASVGVDLSLMRGEILGVVGESGSGKTTLGRMATGIYAPSEGEIYYNGECIRVGLDGRRERLRELDARGRVEFLRLLGSLRLAKEERLKVRESIKNVNEDLQKERIATLDYIKRMMPIYKRNRLAHPKIQMIFQDPTASLNPRLTVGEIVGEGPIIHGMRAGCELDSRIDEVLHSVGLSPRYKSRYPSEFSGGQRQRIGIARAIIMSPEVIIADEPVSALDVSIGAQVINLLFNLKERLGLTIMFIAHDLSVVRHVADRVAVMYKGRVIELAPCEELFSNPHHPYTRALISAMPFADPHRERGRTRFIYDGEEGLDGSLVDVGGGHLVLLPS